MKNNKQMIEIFRKNVDLKRILKDEKNIKISKNSTYLISYTEFIKYLSDLKKITKHNLIIGISFVYSWMPTVLHFRSNDIDLAVDILNKAKKGEVLSEENLETLKQCFNNSLVGTSKMLHFINPEKFAIWDRRVFHYLTGTKPHQYKLKNCRSYLDYLDFCKYITKDSEYTQIHKSIIKKVGYNMSKFRTLEMIMYLKG